MKKRAQPPEGKELKLTHNGYEWKDGDGRNFLWSFDYLINELSEQLADSAKSLTMIVSDKPMDDADCILESISPGDMKNVLFKVRMHIRGAWRDWSRYVELCLRGRIAMFGHGATNIWAKVKRP